MGGINDMLQTMFLVAFPFFPLFHLVGVISLSLSISLNQQLL